MSTEGARENPVLADMVGRLAAAAGSNLHGVLLYGSAARGDFHEGSSDLNLLVVLDSLDPACLESIAPALRHWRRKGQPVPRLFSPALIRDAADVFPIEFHDIHRFHVLLHGEDPFRDLAIRDDNLRLQCERELREKLMRLREAYVECHDRPKRLRQLLTDSYTTFVALFRGCLQLLGAEIPVHNDEITTSFCERAGLDPRPFEEVDRLKRGGRVDAEPKEIFSRYYGELTKTVATVDRFAPGEEGVRP